ncbi:hypothetical protein Mal65_53970 [Crateriforma conspicua]|nr:hypothetical protein Mal65_53970 [Crateriforma conspicua]
MVGNPLFAFCLFASVLAILSGATSIALQSFGFGPIGYASAESGMIPEAIFIAG